MTLLETTTPRGTPTVTSSVMPTEDVIESFGFYAMGDTPYSKLEQVLLEEQIYNMTLFRKPNGVFTVHVGDLWKVNATRCGIDTIDTIEFQVALKCSNLEGKWIYAVN